MSADAVTDDMSKVSLESGPDDAVASGEAIYTSEIRGSDEAGKHLNRPY
jgi:hypothetical protein